ncbi:MAG: hypothetical protein K6T88_09825 [Bacillus sp. (in: Bacteria)]|nr:hypothetical protein [Bacillus sp. (in: firmicutes)]
MFDPTAFDNMKVVIEGAIYDLDISGKIIITDRNDLINLAKMSRKFNVSFQLPYSTVIAKMEMEAKFVNLAAELMPSTLSEQLAGSHVRLEFFLELAEKIDFQVIKDILLDVWGPTRNITQSVQYNPLEIEKRMKNKITVEFDRLISEEQIDDLVEMVDVVMTTLQNLHLLKD